MKKKIVCAGRRTPDLPAVILVTTPTTPLWLLFSTEIPLYNVILKLGIQWVVEVWKYSYNMMLVQRWGEGGLEILNPKRYFHSIKVSSGLTQVSRDIYYSHQPSMFLLPTIFFIQKSPLLLLSWPVLGDDKVEGCDT
jgi:hypothetical protein